MKLLSDLYNVTLKKGIEGAAKSGFIRPTIGENFMSHRDFQEIESSNFPLRDYNFETDTIQDITLTEKSNSTDLFGSLSSGTAKWIGGVLAPNGKIYGVPYYSTQVLEIDPSYTAGQEIYHWSLSAYVNKL